MIAAILIASRSIGMAPRARTFKAAAAYGLSSPLCMPWSLMDFSASNATELAGGVSGSIGWPEATSMGLCLASHPRSARPVGQFTAQTAGARSIRSISLSSGQNASTGPFE